MMVVIMNDAMNYSRADHDDDDDDVRRPVFLAEGLLSLMMNEWELDEWMERSRFPDDYYMTL